MAITRELKEVQYEAKVIDVPELGYVHISFTGVYRPGFKMKMIKVAGEEIQKLGYRKLLGDFTGGSISLSATEVFQRPGYFEEAGIPKDTRIAYVFHPEKTKIDIPFAEDVFFNRGWEVKFFFDLDEALAWLLAKSDEASDQ